MALATSKFCHDSSVRIVESIHQPPENKTQVSETEREKYRTPAARKNVTCDTSQKEHGTVERRKGERLGKNDEKRKIEREREGCEEEGERGEERAKSMTSEAVGAQGCDPTDPTSMPRPPLKPSLALLRALLPSPLAPGVDGRRDGPFFAPHLTPRPHWLPPSRSDLSSLCRP